MKYRKKPVVIEALQVTPATANAVVEWARSLGGDVRVNYRDWGLDVVTLEGVMHANPNDWIICGIKGEFYPCNPDIFTATYEPVEASDG